MKPLPPHLALFVRRAGADELPNSSVRLLSGGMVTQPNRFVRSWGLAYLTGDQAVALEKLELIYAAMQPEPEQKHTGFDIPAGTAKKSCSSCGADIYWIITEAGKKMPVDPDGVSHFATCEHSKMWSGKSRAEVRA